MNDLTIRVYVWMRSILMSEEGQDMIEYALLMSLVAFGATAGMHSFAGGINTAFGSVSHTLGHYTRGDHRYFDN